MSNKQISNKQIINVCSTVTQIFKISQYDIQSLEAYFDLKTQLRTNMKQSLGTGAQSSAGDTIKVFVRVRPLNQKQKSSESCVLVNGKSIEMRDREPDHRFSFDHIFQGQSTQQQVYNSVGHQVVESAFQGFNGTVFAYGQTSSGKTHTCIGPDYTDKQKRGILPRMIGHIYDKIKQEPTYIQFRIKISMVQIYMQKIKDLLDSTKSDLKIRQKAGKGIYIQDVTQQYVASQQETIGIVKRGIVNRSVGQTLMNDTSSRSHMAFIITLYQNNLKDASAKSGRIILVDLAGSQKISKTGAQGKLLDQAKQINKSLLALGNVINALTQNKIAHIPYRDSKLTRLLQQSLGGNSKTNLIINVSPSQLNQHETLSSLRFGNRAKQIKNKPKVNREYTVAQLLLLLEKAQKRIQQLELVISEMSVKKVKAMKKSSQVYVQNLLDSDRPILQTDQQQNINNSIIKQKQKKSSRIKPHYESQFIDSSQDEQKNKKAKQKQQSIPSQVTPSTPSHSQQSKQTQQLQQLVNKIQQQKQVLAQQIQMLNIEKVQITRQFDIMQEKYDLTVKENKSNQIKMNYLTKQNQKLLQKLITQTSLLQQNQLKMQQLQQKINLYEQQILNIAALQQKQMKSEQKISSASVSKIFGTGSSLLAAETRKIAEIVRSHKSKQNNELGLIDLQDKIQMQIQANQNKDNKIKELQSKNKKLEQEIALFQHLEKAKEVFIQQKLKFGAQRERLYKDLENRIQKVLNLQQKLDQQIQKRKYYQQLIKSESSQKNRKILLLQQQINQISQNYYVLKGQQSSWNKDAKRTEQKLQTKNKRIIVLQRQIMALKEQVQNLKLQVQQMQIGWDQRKEDSVLDLDLSVNQQLQNSRPKIVKVVRSSNFRPPQALLQ